MIKYGDKISVSMITLNEELSVKKVINDIQNLDSRIEIVIVDSSSDSTAEIARSMGAKVLKQMPPQGYGPAMDMAFKSATKEIIITLDCDDTYPINEIDNFSKKIIDEDYDVIDGNRLQKKPKNMPIINYLANYFFAIIASILFMIRIKDLHSGMRAYKKKIISDIPYLKKSVSLPVELLLWPIRMKYKVGFVNISYKERIGISKLEPMKAAYWTIVRILRVRFLTIK